MDRPARPLRLPALAASAFPQQEGILPGTTHAPDVPTLESVVGHEPGERISSHGEIERYVRALAGASDRVRLVRYGESWEGRALYYLVVSRPANLARLEEVRAGMQQLADPRELGEERAGALLDDLPSIAWLAYSVHGDEISCSDAGLFVAYHLAAARGDELVDRILADSIVIIDPLQNPDGRERFVFHYRQTRGRWPDAEPAAAEHNQTWPGGRSNHYLFDMNRDWFALTQPESRARVRAFLQWWPQVFVDLHEMGRNSSYYFAPPARPHNPEITPAQHEWLERYGRNNARWFDRFGFDYFVREQFDAFYPGYGEGWPIFHGAIGMTYEQASVRGLVVRRDDETELTYRESVQHHVVASMATLETCARNRREVLAAFLDHRRHAVREGRSGPVREYLLPPTGDAHRTRRLVERLTLQGIEVHRAEGALTNGSAADLRGGETEERTFPAGTLVVRLAQPAGRLAHVLLARHFDMEEEFLEEQREKYARRERTDFYDLTGWSLPLLFDVPCFVAGEASRGEVVPMDGPVAAGRAAPGRAEVAYLVPWGTTAAADLLADLHRAEIRVEAAGEPFVQNGRAFPPGTLIVKVAGNGDGAALHETVARLAAANDAEVVTTDSSWVEEGVSFGSNEVRYLEPPKIALLWDRPVRSTSAGAARFVLERRYDQPVTIVRTEQLGSVELDRFNVLVAPHGFGYGRVLDRAADEVVGWVRRGGTLITFGGATRWLTEEDVGLLAAETEPRQKPGAADDEPEAGEDAGKPDSGEPEPDPAAEDFDYDQAILPDEERPARTPGAILAIDLDPEHWLAFGYRGRCNAVSTTREVFTPVKLDRGTNVGVYAERDRLLLSGFVFGDKLDQLARKAWLIHQPHGRGHVVAFTEDPTFRAFVEGLDLLFLNAVFFGPGF